MRRPVDDPIRGAGSVDGRDETAVFRGSLKRVAVTQIGAADLAAVAGQTSRQHCEDRLGRLGPIHRPPDGPWMRNRALRACDGKV